MELYGRSAGRNGSDRPAEWVPAGPQTGIEESVRRLGFWNSEILYPERPGEPDCAYFMRNGTCGYGIKCRYNHPRDRSSVGVAVRIGGGEFPERPGEPACQFYLRTGTCKFGASCKFHHPRNGGGSISNVPPNSYGFPLRPGEKECSYYLKTGQCKFGITCKFHHPEPGGMSMPAPARPFYSTVQSSPIPSPDQYGGSSTSYRTGRPPLLPGSYVPGAYGPVLLPPGVVPIPGWSPYSGPVSPVLSPSAPPTVGTSSLYGVPQLSSSAPAFSVPYSPLPSTGDPSSVSSSTGLGVIKGELSPQPIGFPPASSVTGALVSCDVRSMIWHQGIRYGEVLVGVQPCAFYLQNGYCKFGHTCKFDHPMGTGRYSPSASSLTDMSVAPYMVGPSLATMAPSFSYSELRPEFISGSNPHSSRMPSSGNTSSSSVGLIFSQTGSASLSDVQLSSQSTAPLSISTISTRQGGEVRRTSSEELGVVTVGELKPSIAGKRSFRPSSSTRHVTEWPISDVSSDLSIEVGTASFALHKDSFAVPSSFSEWKNTKTVVGSKRFNSIAYKSVSCSGWTRGI
ncbi:hypothetical protein TEA_017623 [Camellia sinensis var. sinensis]|uniref:C3H1-type domain-containing protein n=1 Tax=Camellia sinensis var. sinensis TaxID=542762 RepID=A0A4S4CX02_CAMSN|nr:hypothetical protein TEA_017623 [Camellia sinensis var. sinensis]